jgi:eukaryotic-like serine/threonine-protein kinase
LVGSGKVITSRDPELELTKDGAIVGTPLYMPPEQAGGQLQDIDRRSDIYSAGAMLYEVLTLQPPVYCEGSSMGVLIQVIQGQVVPPEQREPQRARAGKIPRELSAVAMKALAKRQEDRYPDAEAMPKDIERFMELDLCKSHLQLRAS